MAKSFATGQLPLHMPLEAARAREDLLVTDCNRAAVAFIDSWPDWPTSIAILAGPVGAGKTHLAHVWAVNSQARVLDPGEAPEAAGVEQGKCFLVENVARTPLDEEWLFHLINTARAHSGSLLLTSRHWPGDWGITLPDLASRLKTAHLIELGEPDDDLLGGVMAKLFSDRQMLVDPAVVDYLVVRMERSLASAQWIVDSLDTMSLATKRAVTRAMAAEVLQEAGGE